MTREEHDMSGWQIIEEPDSDRLGLVNADHSCALYLAQWSAARVQTSHSPPESGINAEVLSYCAHDTWTYSLTHIDSTDRTCTPAYLLEVRINYCLVIKLHIPFACGEKLRQRWLEK